MGGCHAACGEQVFSERLLHASVPYRGTRSQRRTLFYKYLPFGASRADLSGIKKRHYDLTAPEMTDAQRLIMGWPEEWVEAGLASEATPSIGSGGPKL